MLILKAVNPLRFNIWLTWHDNAWIEAGVYGFCKVRQILKSSHCLAYISPHTWLLWIVTEQFFTGMPHLMKRVQWRNTGNMHQHGIWWMWWIRIVNSGSPKERGGHSTAYRMGKTEVEQCHVNNASIKSFFVEESRNVGIILCLEAGEALNKLLYMYL